MNRRTKLLLLTATLLAVPAIAIGGHQFVDVSYANVFHEDIDWLADEGITRGCNPPVNSEFCPSDPVTRGQMAAFMKRFHDRFIVSSEVPPPIGLGYSERSSYTDGTFTGNGVVPGLALDLDIPETGILMITASAEAVNLSEADIFSCGINIGSTPDTAQLDSWRSIDLSVNFVDTCSTQTAIPVDPGRQIARIVVTNAQYTTHIEGGSIMAVLYPLESAQLLDARAEDGKAIEFPDEASGKK